jgi:hypothetical protein
MSPEKVGEQIIINHGKLNYAAPSITFFKPWPLFLPSLILAPVDSSKIPAQAT